MNHHCLRVIEHLEARKSQTYTEVSVLGLFSEMVIKPETVEDFMPHGHASESDCGNQGGNVGFRGICGGAFEGMDS